jgi:hypothetical protein
MRMHFDESGEGASQSMSRLTCNVEPSRIACCQAKECVVVSHGKRRIVKKSTLMQSLPVKILRIALRFLIENVWKQGILLHILLYALFSKNFDHNAQISLLHHSADLTAKVEMFK